MSNVRRRRLARLGARTRDRCISLLCGGLLVDLALQPWRSLRSLAETDFLAFLSGARLLRDGGCVYCTQSQHFSQEAISGALLPAGQQRSFVNPPVAAYVLRPLLDLPPHAALAVFLAISLLALAIGGSILVTAVMPSTLDMSTRIVMVVAGVGSLPAAWGIALGQWDPLLFLAAVGALTLLRNHPAAAGLALSVVAIKPQLVFLVPVALAIGRQWRAIAGFAAGGAVLLATTVTLTPAGAWVGYVTAQEGSLPVETMGLPGLLTSSASGQYVTAAVLSSLAIALMWQWRDRLRAEPLLGIAAGLVLGFLVAPHVLSDDMIVVAVPLALWGSVRPAAAISAAYLLSLAYVIDLDLPVRLAHVETLIVIWIAVGFVRARIMTPDRRLMAPPRVAGEPHPGRTSNSTG